MVCGKAVEEVQIRRKNEETMKMVLEAGEGPVVQRKLLNYVELAQRMERSWFKIRSFALRRRRLFLSLSLSLPQPRRSTIMYPIMYHMAI